MSINTTYQLRIRDLIGDLHLALAFTRQLERNGVTDAEIPAILAEYERYFGDAAATYERDDNSEGAVGCLGCLSVLGIPVAIALYYWNWGGSSAIGAVATVSVLLGIVALVLFFGSGGGTEQRAAAEAARKEAVAKRAAAESIPGEWQASGEAVLEALRAKYGTDTLKCMIVRKPWLGASTNEIRALLGPPERIDEKVMKTRTRHVYKYDQSGKAMFKLSITFDNGLAVEWEDRREIDEAEALRPATSTTELWLKYQLLQRLALRLEQG